MQNANWWAADNLHIWKAPSAHFATQQQAARPSISGAVVCGGGIAGVSAAYHLARLGVKDIVVISAHTPLTLTSAMSTECYRDFWPTETMARLVGRSIDNMEKLAYDHGNSFDMTRRGYAYFTDSEETMALLRKTELPQPCGGVAMCRVHTGDASTYKPGPAGSLSVEELAVATGQADDTAVGIAPPPTGLDLLDGVTAVQSVFPQCGDTVVGALHARRAGWVSAQQVESPPPTASVARGLPQ